jgi:hypothetical protein
MTHTIIRRIASMTMTAALAAVVATDAARGQEPARADGWVVLALDEYRALRAKAFPSPPDPLPPPVDAALTRIEYALRVDGETVTGEARLTIDVLKQGWVSVKMPAGVLVRSARLESRPTALVDGTPPSVLIARAGRSLLALDIVVPIESAGGTETMTLPPSASALSSVNLVVPRTGVDLTVGGGFVAEHAEGAADSRWTVYGSPGRPLTFSWKRRIDDRRSQLPLRARARITELAALGEETSHITASVRVEVVQGFAREVVISTPEGIAVNQVSGATVADWTHQQGSLTVSFLEPITASTSFVVSAEARVPRDGSVAIPIIRMPSAERETGGLVVDVVGAGEITERQPRGFDPADASDLGDIVSGRESPSMVAFHFKPLPGSAPRALTVTVSRYTPQAVLVANVEEARYEALIGEDGKRLIRARYAVRNNQRAFLAVKLPAQSVLWSAALSGQPVRPGLSADGGYLLPLQKGRAGESAPTFAVELVYLERAEAWTEKGDARVELPAVDLPVSRTGLIVHYSPRFEVEPRPGAFRSDTDSGPWSAALREENAGVPPPPPPAMPSTAAPKVSEKDAPGFQGLMDRFRKEMGKSTTGLIPVDVKVPNLGPTFFVAAELTAESRGPALDIHYKRVSERSGAR